MMFGVLIRITVLTIPFSRFPAGHLQCSELQKKDQAALPFFLKSF
jgi:hypothetical protein